MPACQKPVSMTARNGSWRCGRLARRALAGLCLCASALALAEDDPARAATSVSKAAALTVFTEEWPPASFSQNGRAEGMAVEVVREMLRRAGQEVEIEVVPWARGFRMVSEVPNVLLFAVIRTPEREALMTLIGPLLIARTEIYQKRGAGWQGKSDDELRQAVVGTYRSSAFEATARKHGFNRIDLAVRPENSARMLLGGRIDLWIDMNVSVPSIVQSAGGKPGDIEAIKSLDAAELMLAVSRGTPVSVVLALENALRAMKADGSYQRIFLRWFPHDTPPRQTFRVGVEPH